jgi:hypothetical protein
VVEFCKHSGEAGRDKEVISTGTFKKQKLEKQKG